jgi:hypothetical protein
VNRDALACGELTQADSWAARTGVRAVDMINRDGIRLRWETLGCKLEASSWSRVTDVAASSARDQLEAGLNEAASGEHALWALVSRTGGAVM